MARLLERLEKPESLLWLDATAYAERLLAGGHAPWLDLDSCIAWLGKTQRLLNSEVVGLPLAAISQAWLTAHPPLKEAMASKRRVGYPLKTMLADEGLRAYIVDLLKSLRAAQPRQLLVLVLPSPRAWLLNLYQQVHGEPLEAELDSVEGAATYLADFLRVLANVELDALLLEEDVAHEPANVAEVQWYQPLLNLAQHYRWDVGLRLPSATCYTGGGAGLDYLIAPRQLPGQFGGVALSEAFWNGEPAPSSKFLFAQIPPDSNPEKVLARLAELNN